MTSNQFESVETWEVKQYPGGVERLEVQVTVLRSARLRQTGQRRLRVPSRARISRQPAIASSTGSARRATTTSSTRARPRRSCPASRGSRMREERRCFRITRPVARPDLQHHAPGREGVGDEDGVARCCSSPWSRCLPTSRRDRPPFVRDVRPHRRESDHRHGGALGSSIPRTRGSISTSRTRTAAKHSGASKGRRRPRCSRAASPAARSSPARRSRSGTVR